MKLKLREVIVAIIIVAAGVWLGVAFAPPDYVRRAVWMWILFKVLG